MRKPTANQAEEALFWLADAISDANGGKSDEARMHNAFIVSALGYIVDNDARIRAKLTRMLQMACAMYTADESAEGDDETYEARNEWFWNNIYEHWRKHGE